MRLFRLLTSAFLAVSLTTATFTADAQHNGRRPGSGQTQDSRNHNRNSGQRPSAPGQRPGSNGHHNDNGNHGGNSNHAYRPGNNSNNRPVRPGNNVAPSRPGHDKAPARPGHNMSPTRPGHNMTPPPHPQRPQPAPGYYPGHPSRPSHAIPRPPMRPNLPATISTRWHNRPVPPASFRPHYHLTPLQAILGVALGTTLNLTINSLSANNYVIQGYNNNCLYLSDVNAMGFFWPDAVLYYSGGALASSTFCYATDYYNTNRFNTLYRNLSNQYGAPISYNRGNSSLSATWWGYNNQYITLELQRDLCIDGYNRYMTTLRIGR